LSFLSSFATALNPEAAIALVRETSPAPGCQAAFSAKVWEETISRGKLAID
jgi:hypothetical protein